MSSNLKEVFQFLKQQLGKIPFNLKQIILASLSTSTLIPTGIKIQAAAYIRAKGLQSIIRVNGSALGIAIATQVPKIESNAKFKNIIQ